MVSLAISHLQSSCCTAFQRTLWAEPLQHSRNLQFHWAQMNPDSLRPSTQRAHKAKSIRKAALITPYILGTFQPSVPLYNPSSTKKSWNLSSALRGWQHQVSYFSDRSEAGSFQPLRAVTSQTLLAHLHGSGPQQWWFCPWLLLHFQVLSSYPGAL